MTCLSDLLSGRTPGRRQGLRTYPTTVPGSERLTVVFHIQVVKYTPFTSDVSLKPMVHDQLSCPVGSPRIQGTGSGYRPYTVSTLCLEVSVVRKSRDHDDEELHRRTGQHQPPPEFSPTPFRPTGPHLPGTSISRRSRATSSTCPLFPHRPLAVL